MACVENNGVIRISICSFAPISDFFSSLLESVVENPESLSLEDLLEQRLLERGVISEIPKRLPDPEQYREFKPVEVKGKPVSETIIEERG